MSETIQQLQGKLEWAEKQISWLKEDKVSLNKSVKVRDNAFTALIDMNKKTEKQLQAENEHLCNTIEATRQDMVDLVGDDCEATLYEQNVRHRIELDKAKDDNKRLRGIVEEVAQIRKTHHGGVTGLIGPSLIDKARELMEST